MSRAADAPALAAQPRNRARADVSQGESRSEARLAVLVVLALVALGVLWAAIVYALRAEYEQAERQQRDRNGNIVRLLAAHVERTLANADRLSQLMVWAHEHGMTSTLPDMFAQLDLPSMGVVQAGVAAADGRMIWSTAGPSRPSIGDREHFLVHRDQPTGSAFVSKPVFGRVSKKWSIQLSRRIEGPGGTFAGVSVASIDPFYFTSVYTDLALGARSRIVLVGDDGVVRATAQGSGPGVVEISMGDRLDAGKPFELIGKSRSGTWTGESSVDGLERVFAWHRVQGYDLVAVVGTSIEESTTGYYTNRLVFVSAGVVATGLLVALALSLGWGILRSQRQFELLRSAHEGAERIGARRLRLLGAISHELRTPLSTVIGFADLCVKPGVSLDQTRDHARHIKNAARQIAHMVDDLLDYERIESGSVTILPEQVDAPGRVFACIEAIEARAAERGIRFDYSDHSESMVFFCDPRQVDAVANRLLEYAVERSPDGEVVRVDVSRWRDWLRIVVSDAGAPIPREQQGVLFGDAAEDRAKAPWEPSASVRPALKMVRTLVILMGGRIWIEPGAVSGVSVHVELPNLEIAKEERAG